MKRKAMTWTLPAALVALSPSSIPATAFVIAPPERDHDLLTFPVDGRIELTARVTMERV
ncbi:hypothetical protein [Streptomyces sp. Ag109_O5-1]|uniref:hypothetical protein n=1 Tax=Streptomyces sp. Ag109_O5-1 TaxID=1938851 RepID=UPI001629790C|nr:hypothetical protein [Streptomyces sp. Ag109_O5-1]